MRPGRWRIGCVPTAGAAGNGIGTRATGSSSCPPSPDLYIRPLGAILGADDVICTEMEVVDLRLTRSDRSGLLAVGGVAVGWAPVVDILAGRVVVRVILPSPPPTTRSDVSQVRVDGRPAREEHGERS
jgi:hypothetical protein